LLASNTSISDLLRVRTGCSASGVRNAISTLKWLENENTKYMSQPLRQKHLQSKLKLVDEWKQTRNIEGRNGGGDRCRDGDRDREGDPESMDSHSLSRQGNEEDDDGRAHNTENSNSITGVEEEEDDEEILDPDDLIRTPSIAELSADVAVLSNPYKDKFGILNSRDDKTEENKMVGGRDIEKEKEVSSTPVKKKGRWPEKDKDSSSSPKGQKVVVKKVNLKGKGNLDSEFQAKAGLRAEEGDYSGLLVNGLFASSVLRTGSYYKAKDKAIVKVFNLILLNPSRNIFIHRNRKIPKEICQIVPTLDLITTLLPLSFSLPPILVFLIPTLLPSCHHFSSLYDLFLV
jgi:hypothetical protein